MRFVPFAVSLSNRERPSTLRQAQDRQARGERTAGFSSSRTSGYPFLYFIQLKRERRGGGQAPALQEMRETGIQHKESINFSDALAIRWGVAALAACLQATSAQSNLQGYDLSRRLGVAQVHADHVVGVLEGGRGWWGIVQHTFGKGDDLGGVAQQE